MKGKAFVFGDNINTDMIINRKHYRGSKPISETAEHVFEPIRPEFTDQVQEGDIVVAGEHFGSGSSRPAPEFIRETGVSAVVAESFARIYYRNSIGVGMPAIISAGITDVVSDGDTIEIDLDANKLINHTTGEEHDVEPYPEIFEEIRDAGGLLEYYNERSEDR